MVQPPFCDNGTNLNYDNGCGNKVTAYLYFLSFTLLGSWIMLNLFLAVVMENYESNGDDNKVIDEYDMEDFKKEWMKIDTKGEGVIRVTSLRALLMQVGWSHSRARHPLCDNSAACICMNTSSAFCRCSLSMAPHERRWIAQAWGRRCASCLAMRIRISYYAEPSDWPLLFDSRVHSLVGAGCVRGC